MSFDAALDALHARIQGTVGLAQSPDEIQDLVDADLGQFEGSYQIKLLEPGFPYQDLSLTLTEFSSALQVEVGAEINNDRNAANKRLNGYMVAIWRQVVADLSWTADIKSIVPMTKPQIFTSPAQPNRLVMVWSWQVIYLE